MPGETGRPGTSSESPMWLDDVEMRSAGVSVGEVGALIMGMHSVTEAREGRSEVDSD